MEWILLIGWLMIINGALGGQYILNWMGNQQKFVGDQPVGVSPGVMTWWREISKLLWAVIAVIIEIIRGKELKYLLPGAAAMVTIIICAFTGVIENIGFFYLPKYYSPHLYAPYVNVYLVMLPFLGKLLFNAAIRKEHWIGISLVVVGLAVPHIPRILGRASNPDEVLDFTAIVWVIIINCCLCSQQILNNKTVQLAAKGVGPNALVVWREIWKMVFIWSALIIFPIVGSLLHVNFPQSEAADKFEQRVLSKISEEQKTFLHGYYERAADEYVIKKSVSKEDEEKIKKIISEAGYNRFFSLFDGSIIPKNWWPILFVVLAGLTGYIYSFGFFKLSKFAAHYWVPYTNIWLAVLPFVMFLFGKEVTTFQVIGAVVTSLGLIVGVSDHKRNKVEEIEKKNK
jgi:drug/metabolite transporter (DMT)-like permease